MGMLRSSWGELEEWVGSDVVGSSWGVGGSTKEDDC